jgi:hypothetical protein
MASINSVGNDVRDILAVIRDVAIWSGVLVEVLCLELDGTCGL